ncbi:MAG TPA: hypothetical protein VNM92_00855 [Thermoanaerobaculia bacterium]|nr:hypothetical protein [Thermoanaerobaculia bacterium]
MPDIPWCRRYAACLRMEFVLLEVGDDRYWEMVEPFTPLCVVGIDNPPFTKAEAIADRRISREVWQPSTIWQYALAIVDGDGD